MRIELEINGKRVDAIESKGEVLTIGRSPDNDLRLDNLAVSAHHARIEKRGLGWRVSDLGSTNGTFVGGERIRAKELTDGDEVTIGKHTLVFFSAKGRAGRAPRKASERSPAMDATMVLETARQRERLEREAQAEFRRNGGKVGVLKVVAGGADRGEYEMLSPFVMIGRSPEAGVRLHGVLDPKVAGFVERGPSGYVLVPPENGNKLKLNGATVKERTPLSAGDAISIRGTSLRFELRP